MHLPHENIPPKLKHERMRLIRRNLTKSPSRRAVEYITISAYGHL